MVSDPQDLTSTDRWWAATSWATIMAVAVCAQVVRYKRISTKTEQHQSRWVMLGVFWLTIPLTLLAVLITTGASSPGLTGAMVTVVAVASYVLPVAVLVAVFRHHLYDIDRTISRTLTYAAVVVVVGAVYTLLVVLLPLVPGGADDVVVATSTLVAAAVFNPIREWVQHAVERRFNRGPL